MKVTVITVGQLKAQEVPAGSPLVKLRTRPLLARGTQGETSKDVFRPKRHERRPS
jgi:hypothetical protein